MTRGGGTSLHVKTSLARWKTLTLTLTSFLYICFENCHSDSQMGTFPLIWGSLGDSEHVGDISKQAENRRSCFL